MNKTNEDAYTKYKQNTFFEMLDNMQSISSGVNLFGILELYKNIMKLEIENENSITGYSAPQGHKLMIEAFVYYENFLGGSNMNIGISNLCLVSGATSALSVVFEYLATKNLRKGVLLGYSYTLFSLLGQRHKIQLDVLVSTQKGRILPELQLITDYISKNKPEIVCLTDPANPSGEMCSLEAFRGLLRLCKENNCILLIDRCQRDELQLVNNSNYFSLNRIIAEEHMFENVIIVNSLSKTRGIPGMRIGYVVANTEMIDYLIYLNATTYWHSNAMCSFAVTIDILYQMIYMNSTCKDIYINDIIKMIKKYISNVRIMKELYRYLYIDKVDLYAHLFCEKIIERYNSILANYEWVKSYANKEEMEITNLEGGFNFCIKVDRYAYERNFKYELSQKYSMEVFTQEDFCCESVNAQKDYWMRISCAEEKESFRKKFSLICDFLEKK